MNCKKIMMLIYSTMITASIMAMLELPPTLDQIQDDLRKLSHQVHALNTNLTIVEKQSSFPAGFIKLPSAMQWIGQNPDKPIYQIKVLQQAGPTLPKDDYTHSGYHALKNGVYILDALKSSGLERTKFLEELIDPKMYNHLLRSLKLYIEKLRPSKSTTWLQKEEIESLLPNLVSKTNNPQQYFTVIPYSRLFGSNDPLVQKFKASPTFMHIVILGLTSGGSVLPPPWIAVAINKVNNNVQYLIMDSRNIDRTQSSDVLRLIHFIEQ